MRNCVYILLLCIVSAGCKRSERAPSAQYDPKNYAVPLSFTQPPCTVNLSYYVYYQIGSVQGNYYIQNIAESIFYSNGNRNIKIELGSNNFIELKFKYMRPEMSANYMLKSKDISMDNLDFNDVSILGHNISTSAGPGSLNSNQGGQIHVEYLPGSGRYKISACNIPLTYKSNISGATQTMSLYFQVFSD